METGSLQAINFLYDEIIRVGPNPVGLMERGNLDTETDPQQGDLYLNMKAEIGVVRPQARTVKDHQESTRNQGRGLDRVLLHSPQRHQPRGHLDLGLLASRTVRHKRLLFKSLTLWHLVTAALAN